MRLKKSTGLEEVLFKNYAPASNIAKGELVFMDRWYVATEDLVGGVVKDTVFKRGGIWTGEVFDGCAGLEEGVEVFVNGDLDGLSTFTRTGAGAIGTVAEIAEGTDAVTLDFTNTDEEWADEDDVYIDAKTGKLTTETGNILLGEVTAADDNEFTVAFVNTDAEWKDKDKVYFDAETGRLTNAGTAGELGEIAITEQVVTLTFTDAQASWSTEDTLYVDDEGKITDDEGDNVLIGELSEDDEEVGVFTLAVDSDITIVEGTPIATTAGGFVYKDDFGLTLDDSGTALVGVIHERQDKIFDFDIGG